MSANVLTKSVLNYLTACGYEVWRVNTTGLYDTKKQLFRKNPSQKKGVSDVLGFCKSTGTIIAVEVKVGKDKLSIEQTQFLESVKNSGGIAIVARTIDQFLDECKQLKIQ